MGNFNLKNKPIAENGLRIRTPFLGSEVEHDASLLFRDDLQHHRFLHQLLHPQRLIDCGYHLECYVFDTQLHFTGGKGHC